MRCLFVCLFVCVLFVYLCFFDCFVPQLHSFVISQSFARVKVQATVALSSIVAGSAVSAALHILHVQYIHSHEHMCEWDDVYSTVYCE